MSFQLQTVVCRHLFKSHRIFTSINSVTPVSSAFITRNYHIANNNKYDCRNASTTRNLLLRSSFHLTPARTFGDVPVTAAASNVIAPLVTSEPTLASVGLCANNPVGMVQSFLEMLHVTCGLPWYLTIAATALCVRVLIFPIMVALQQNNARLKNNLPELEAVQKQLKEASKNHDQVATMQLTQELRMLYNEKNCSPLKSIVMPLLQMPIFITTFFAINGMVSAPVESFHTGGALWFIDLTTTDSYYLLPAIMSASLAVNIQMAMDQNMMANENAKIMRILMRLAPFISFPLTMHFNAAILCYWVTNNLLTILQVALFRTNSGRDFFNIDRLIVHNKQAAATKNDQHVEEETFDTKNSFANIISSSKELDRKRKQNYDRFLAAQKAAQNRSTLKAEMARKKMSE